MHKATGCRNQLLCRQGKRTLKMGKAFMNKRDAIIVIKYSRLSHDVVTCDVDHDAFTAYC